MKGPDKLKLSVTGAEQRQAHQRRLPQVKPTTAVLFEIFLEHPIAFSHGKRAPVLHLKWQLNVCQHHLQRCLKSFPLKSGPEDTMPSHHLIPCIPELRNVQ